MTDRTPPIDPATTPPRDAPRGEAPPRTVEPEPGALAGDARVDAVGASSTRPAARLWRLLLVVSFGTAVASFIYEIAWIRMLSLVLGSATHSFELMLSAFILGLALDVINVPFAILFMLVAYGYAILVTLAAMTLEEMTFRKYTRWRDLGVMLLAAVAENIGYRQLTAWWRLQGWWASLRGREQVWGTMTRVGLGEKTKT